MGASMWRRFLWAFAITGASALVLCLLLILLVDPIGISPIALGTPKSGYAFKDRRFLAQEVIRSGAFDSFLVGSSTLHSVDPDWADAAFGGRFANVSIHGSTLYELRRVIELAGRRVPDLKRVVLGIDVKRWCRAEPPRRYHRKAVFPEWLYDGSRLNDFEALLNMKMLNAALGQLAVDLGYSAPAVPANGYRNELDDTKWAAFKAKEDRCDGGCNAPVALEEDNEDEPEAADEHVRVYPALDLAAGGDPVAAARDRVRRRAHAAQGVGAGAAVAVRTRPHPSVQGAHRPPRRAPPGDRGRFLPGVGLDAQRRQFLGRRSFARGARARADRPHAGSGGAGARRRGRRLWRGRRRDRGRAAGARRDGRAR